MLFKGFPGSKIPKERRSSQILEKLVESQNRLIKEGRLTSDLDNVEMEHLVASAQDTSLKGWALGAGSEYSMPMGIVTRYPGSLHDIRRKSDKELIPLLPFIAGIGNKCLVHGGLLGEEYLGRIPLHNLATKSFNAAADITAYLSKSESFRHLVLEAERQAGRSSEPGLSMDEVIHYLRVLGHRYPEYKLILNEARLMEMKLDFFKDDARGFFYIGFDINEVGRKQAEAARVDEKRLLRKLGIPSKESFFRVINSLREYESLLEYRVEPDLLGNSTIKRLEDIDFEPSFDIYIDAARITDPHVLNSLLPIKKGLFLLNTFYRDNRISFSEFTKKGNYIFRKQVTDRLKRSMESSAENFFYSKIDSLDQDICWRRAWAHKERIKAKLDLMFDELAEEYEGLTPLRELALNSGEYFYFKDFFSDGESAVDLFKYASLQLLKGIETSIHSIPRYEKDKSTEGVIRQTEGIIDKIKGYLGLMGSMEGIFMETKNEMLAYSIRELSQRIGGEELIEDIIDNYFAETRELMRAALSVHANLTGVGFCSSYSYRLFNTGENIEMYFQLARLIRGEADEQSNFNHMKMDTAAVTGEVRRNIRELTILKKDDKLPHYSDEMLIENLAEHITGKPEYRELIERASRPLDSLAESLSVLGVPEIMGKKLEHALRKELKGEVVSGETPGQEEASHPGQNPIELVFQGYGYNELLDSLIESFNRHSPSKAPRLRHSHLNIESDEINLGLFSESVLVYGKRGGRQKIVFRRDCNPNTRHLLEGIETMFPEDDIYVGRILGVASPFEFSKGGFIRDAGRSEFSADLPVFEVYGGNEFYLEEIAQAMHTYYHEIFHLSRRSTIQRWRRISAIITEFVIDYYLSKRDLGLHESTPFFSANYVRFNKEVIEKNAEERLTIKDFALQFLDEFSRVAMGTGSKAESMRKSGFYEGGCTVFEQTFPNFFKPTGISTEDIALEDSAASRLAQRALHSIRKDDVSELLKLREELNTYHEELSAIEETRAEVMGTIITQKTLEELACIYPEKRSNFIRVADEIEQEMLAVSELTRKSAEILEMYGEQPSRLDKELNKAGMRYQRAIWHRKDIVPVCQRLAAIGVPRHLVNHAVNNYSALSERIASAGMEPSLFYLPTNRARAGVNTKYRANIPSMLENSKLYPELSWSLIESAESMEIAAAPIRKALEKMDFHK